MHIEGEIAIGEAASYAAKATSRINGHPKPMILSVVLTVLIMLSLSLVYTGLQNAFGWPGWLFLPAIIIMSLLNLGLFTTGAKVLQERSASTLRLYRMLPLPFWTYFAAEFLTKLLLALGITLVFLLCAVALLDTGLGLERWLLTLA